MATFATPDPVLSPWAGPSFTLDTAALGPVGGMGYAAINNNPYVAPFPETLTALPGPATVASGLDTTALLSPNYIYPTTLTGVTPTPSTYIYPTTLTNGAILTATSTLPTITSTPSLTTNSTARPTHTPKPKPESHHLRAWQIFLIAFFGLASLIASIAFILFAFVLRRPRDFSHDEEWSSSFWKRHHKRSKSAGSTYTNPRDSTLAPTIITAGRDPNRDPDSMRGHPTRDSSARDSRLLPSFRNSILSTTLGAFTGRGSASNPTNTDPSAPIDAKAAKAARKTERVEKRKKRGDRQWGQVSPSTSPEDSGPSAAAAKPKGPSRAATWSTSSISTPYPGTKQTTRETELGRAWGRPRAQEDEPDRVLVVPAPRGGPGKAVKTSAPILTREAKMSPTLMTPGERRKSLAAAGVGGLGLLGGTAEGVGGMGVNVAGGDSSRKGSSATPTPRSARFDIDDGTFDTVPLSSPPAAGTAINNTGTGGGSRRVSIIGDAPLTPTSLKRLTKSWARFSFSGASGHQGAETSDEGPDAATGEKSKRSSWLPGQAQRRESRGNRRYSMEEAEDARKEAEDEAEEEAEKEAEREKEAAAQEDKNTTEAEKTVQAMIRAEERAEKRRQREKRKSAEKEAKEDEEWHKQADEVERAIREAEEAEVQILGRIRRMSQDVGTVRYQSMVSGSGEDGKKGEMVGDVSVGDGKDGVGAIQASPLQKIESETKKMSMAVGRLMSVSGAAAAQDDEKNTAATKPASKEGEEQDKRESRLPGAWRGSDAGEDASPT